MGDIVCKDKLNSREDSDKSSKSNKNRQGRLKTNENQIRSFIKTQFSPGFQQLIHHQKGTNSSNQFKSLPKPISQGYCNLNSRSEHDNKKIKSAIKQDKNQSLIQATCIFKNKSNTQKEKDCFQKSRKILGLNQLEAHNLDIIKKVYPKLAKINKRDCGKLIELNQAFFFLRVFYFKTQFGTTAVYQSDQNSVLQKNCNVLNLSFEDYHDIVLVKNNFSSIMMNHRMNKKKRIEISIAFQYLANLIFKVQKSAQQIKLIDAVIVCDKDTLIEIFTENKNFINYRQKGSDYSLLYIATRSGHYEIVELILRMGCSKDFQNHRSTPLHCAAFYGHKQILELLLSYGLPHNVKNMFGVLPIDQANSDEVKRILKNVNKDEVQQLILRLKDQQISLTCISIKDSYGDVMARKILLKNYFDQYKDYIDAFHGTTFQALQSIAKHGLQKPGTIIDGKEIKVAAGHIGEERLEIEQIAQNKDTWCNAIFLSESYNYASCPCYSKDYHTMNHITGRNQQWVPLVQAKIKNNSYKRYQSTTDEHQILFNEPFDLQFRVQDSSKVAVIAIVLIRRQYIREKPNKNYIKTTELILNSREEIQFRLDYQQNKPKKILHVLGNVEDNHFNSLIEFLANENLYKSAINIYSKDKTITGRKICLKNGVKDSSQYVNAYHTTDYNSLWLIKKYGIKHLLNERKQLFVSPNPFDYCEINQLPRLKSVNKSTNQKQQWAVILQMKIDMNVFLQTKRSKDFISNWKEFSRFKFRIKSQYLQLSDIRLHLVAIIFVNLKFITSEEKYKLIIHQIN